jgi:hypothetical protein
MRGMRVMGKRRWWRMHSNEENVSCGAHKVIIWGTENHHVTYGLERAISKVNIWCVTTRDKVHGSGESWSGSQVVRKCNIIKSPNSRTIMLRYVNFFIIMPLLCYTVKYFFYINPVLLVRWRITSQTGGFATGVRSSFLH